MKKIIKIVFSLLFVLIVTLVSVPYLFKDHIERIIKEEINNSVNAKIDYQNVSLSLLKDFPNLHVGIENITVDGIAEFKNIRLAKIDRFTMSLNARKMFIDKDLEIKKIGIDGADINIKVLKNGKANYDIIKASNDTVDTPKKKYEIKIKEYYFNNSNIIYDDASTNLHLKMFGIDHHGNGKFTSKNYLLNTKTTAQNFDIIFDHIHYINNVKTNIDMKMLIENTFSKYTMKDISMKLNDLELTSDIMFDLKDDQIAMDISYQTKQNQLIKLLSLVPKHYMPDLQGMKTNGTANLSGFVKGIYKNNILPAFGVDFNIKNGYIKYPNLPESVKNVNAIAKISFSGGNNLDKMSIDLPKIHFSIADNTVDGRLRINNPTTDPLIYTKFKGAIDLAKVKEAIYLPEIKKLGGILDANVALKGRTSVIEKQQYDKFQANGYFSLRKMQYVSDSLPYSITVNEAKIDISPQAMQVKKLKVIIGKSDFNISGNIRNYITYFTKKNKILKANFSMQSDYINLNEFMTVNTSQNDSIQTGIIRIPKNLDITFKSTAKKMKYKNMNLNNVQSTVAVKNEKATLSTVLMKTLGGQLKLKGKYDTSKELAKSNLSINMEKMSITQSANTFSSFDAFAPVLKKVNGNFFSNMTMAVDLDKKMSPILKTMNAAGDFNTNNIQIADIDILSKIARLIKIPNINKANINQIKAQFKIENGSMTIKPFNFKLNSMKAQFGGKIDLSQQINFTLNLDVPKSKLGNKASKVLKNLVGDLNKLGLKADIPDIIKIKFNISGNYDHPTIKPIIAGYEGNTTKEIITKVVTDKVNEVVDDGKEKVYAEAQKRANELIKIAKEQSSTLINEAQKQGDKLVLEAKNIGDKIVSEAKLQGNNLIKKAGNDPFKKMAAKSLAKNLNNEATKKSYKLISVAQNKKQQLVNNAKQKGNSLISKAKQKGDLMIQKIK